MRVGPFKSIEDVVGETLNRRSLRTTGLPDVVGAVEEDAAGIEGKDPHSAEKYIKVYRKH